MWRSGCLIGVISIHEIMWKARQTDVAHHLTGVMNSDRGQNLILVSVPWTLHWLMVSTIREKDIQVMKQSRIGCIIMFTIRGLKVRQISEEAR